jgi:transcriptional regulator with XRE-family HTH domain
MTRAELTALIAKKRHEAGMSEAAAAKLAGISQSVWHRTEKGEPRVSAETLVRMAAAVGITVEHVEEFRLRRK